MPQVFKVLDRMRPIYEWAYKIILFICKLLLVIDILITTMAVIGRFVPFIPDPAWSEQVVLTLMVYMAVLSATLAIRKGSHIRLTAFDRRLPKRLVKVLDIVSDSLVLVLGIVMLIYGWKVCTSPLATFGRYESMPWLSRFWMYFPIPMAGAGMIIFTVEQVYLHIRALFIKEDAQELEVQTP